MAVGHGRMLQSGQLMALDGKVGDRVLFGRSPGTETKLIGAEYIVMCEDGVFGILESAADTAKITTQAREKE